jgi:hypothetical protein
LALETGGNDGADVEEAEEFWRYAKDKYGLSDRDVARLIQ